MAAKAPKTVNNVLTVLNVLLKKAAEWGVIERMPCTIRLLKVPRSEAGFLDFDEYERLVVGAQASGATTLLVVLLAGDAGLHCGEVMALHWTDVDPCEASVVSIGTCVGRWSSVSQMASR